MPEIEIIAHPVFPDEVRHHWWAARATAILLVGEYDKYLGALVRPILERLRWASATEPTSTERTR
jgi:hypothetical protein